MINITYKNSKTLTMQTILECFLKQCKFHFFSFLTRPALYIYLSISIYLFMCNGKDVDIAFDRINE